MTIESNRTMGGVAACLFVTGVVSQVISILQNTLPSTSGVSPALAGISSVIGVLAFLGLILFFVAMHGFSKDYGEPKIFNYLVFGLIAVIIFGILAVIVGVAIAFSNASSLFPSFNFTSPFTTPIPPSQSQINSVVGKSLLPLLPVFAVIALIWIVYNVLALNLLGDKSKIALFRTGAKVLLAGASVTIAVTIVFAVIASSLSLSFNTVRLTFSVPGGFVQDAAWVLLAMAYFRIQAPLAPAVAPANVPSITTAAGQAKSCPKCGASNQSDAIFCSRCGQKL